MTVKELQKIINLRAQSGNPTESSLMFLISQKLDELQEENENYKIENEKLRAELDEVDC